MCECVIENVKKKNRRPMSGSKDAGHELFLISLQRSECDKKSPAILVLLRPSSKGSVFQQE